MIKLSNQVGAKEVAPGQFFTHVQQDNDKEAQPLRDDGEIYLLMEKVKRCSQVETWLQQSNSTKAQKPLQWNLKAIIL